MARTVLVVDHDPGMLRVLATLLDLDDLTVATASSAEEALRRLATVQPDVVLAAATLPDVGGFELAGRLKAQRPAVTVVVLGDSASGPAASACDACLPTPFSPLELVATVSG